MRGKKGSKTRNSTKAARTGVTISVVLLLAALLLSAGLAGGFLLTRSRIPQSLESKTAAGSMKVTSTRFDDSRSVQLTLTLGSSSTIVSPVSGTVTSTACAKGATVASGSAPIAVDAVPQLALNTATPPYRRLTSGTRGPDARALNDALRALGYAAPDSDWFVWDSIVAYNALADNAGARRITKEGGWAIDPSFFIWLPASAVTVADCRAAVGRQITQGADLFVTSAMPVKATFPNSQTTQSSQSGQSSQSAQSSAAIAGDRIISINKQDIPVPAGTTELNDQTAMAAITSSSEYRLAAMGGGTSGSAPAGTDAGAGAGGEESTMQVSFTWRLANPIESIAVPPSALYDMSGGTACVTVKGDPTPVTIIASQLGKTMVSPDGVDPFPTVDVSPATSAPCRK